MTSPALGKTTATVFGSLGLLAGNIGWHLSGHQSLLGHLLAAVLLYSVAVGLLGKAVSAPALDTVAEATGMLITAVGLAIALLVLIAQLLHVPQVLHAGAQRLPLLGTA